MTCQSPFPAPLGGRLLVLCHGAKHPLIAGDAFCEFPFPVTIEDVRSGGVATLDMEPGTRPDIVHDLRAARLPPAKFRGRFRYAATMCCYYAAWFTEEGRWRPEALRALASLLAPGGVAWIGVPRIVADIRGGKDPLPFLRRTVRSALDGDGHGHGHGTVMAAMPRREVSTLMQAIYGVHEHVSKSFWREGVWIKRAG